MMLKPYPADAAKAIEHDLDGWVAHMKAIRDTVPDFWSELNTAERLGEWLAACGYRKITS